LSADFILVEVIPFGAVEAGIVGVKCLAVGIRG
jgi:hypothetical protein